MAGSRGGTHTSQSEVAHEGVEITVAMEQLVTADNASCGQDNVDRPSYSNAEVAQLSVVLRGLDNGVFAAEIDQVKSPKKAPSFIECLVAGQGQPDSSVARRA